MALNWDTSSTYFFVDKENKMMLTQNPGWNLSGNNEKGDAIGRTFTAYFCYGDERFIEGIESCWVRKERCWFWKLLGKDYYYQGFRYPTHDDNDLSRDHTLYAISTFKYSGYSDEALKEFVTHLRFRISKRYFFTLDSWFWVRAIYGSKFYRFLFYLMEIPTMWFTAWWNKIIYWIAPFDEESSQDEWIKIQNDMKPNRLVRLAKMLYPIYALHNMAWQIYLLPDSRLKKSLQKICLKMTPRYNYVIKMLLGDNESFTKEDVWNYKAMTGDRWTGILNPWINDRDMDIITDESLIQDNNIEVDYVRNLYNTIRIYN